MQFALKTDMAAGQATGILGTLPVASTNGLAAAMADVKNPAVKPGLGGDSEPTEQALINEMLALAGQTEVQ